MDRDKGTVKLYQMLERFLRKRRKPDGDWPDEIDEKDMELLENILRELIVLKFAVDSDGDPPVRFVLVDRTHYEHFAFHPVRKFAPTLTPLTGPTP